MARVRPGPGAGGQEIGDIGAVTTEKVQKVFGSDFVVGCWSLPSPSAT